MQEHLSKDAKKAEQTLWMNHIPTPSTLPHPCDDPWLDDDRTLGSLEELLDRKLKKLEHVVAMELEVELSFGG